MVERLFVPLNWMLGTLGLILAVAFPLIDANFLQGAYRTGAEQVVERIAKAQQVRLATQDRYQLFRVGEMPQDLQKEVGISVTDSNDFVFDAFMEGEALVIRAQAAPDRVRSGAMSPLAYRYSKPPKGSVSKEWLPLSGKKAGLIPGLF